MWLEEESRSFTHCCSPKSRQQEIREELAQRYGIDLEAPSKHICFSHNQPENLEIVHSEYVDSVQCILYFWLSD